MRLRFVGANSLLFLFLFLFLTYIHITIMWPLCIPALFDGQENKFFEDSFKVYERGVVLFKYPHVKDIWQAYLKQFVAR